MDYRRLGNTDISVSVVGLGGWSVSSGYDWSNATPPDVSSLVSASLEVGINWIDTAPVYMQSEVLLGRALKGCRDRFIIASKCGLIKKDAWNVHDLRKETLITQCENSLRALQTDYLDIYQIHYPHFSVPLEEAVETLQQLQQQGKIRAVGLCNVSAPQILSLPFPVASVQNEFSLLHPQAGAAVWHVCRQKEISFIGYGTLCGGILSGKYQKEPNFRRADARNYFYKCYKGTAFEQALGVVKRVREVANRYHCLPVQVAIGWALAHKEVSSVLVGAKTVEQVLQNARSCDVKLTEEECLYLEQGNDKIH